MALKQLQVVISAVVEYDDDEFDKNDVDEAVVICFRKEDKYSGEELFLPFNASMRVVDYIETFSVEE